MPGSTPQPEVWLRGPIDGVEPALQPVAHALLQALEDAERICAEVEPGQLWARPGGAASIGFHLRHAAGSLERLLTYARGEQLSDKQRDALAVEKETSPQMTMEQLFGQFRAATEHALAQLRETSDAILDEPRAVGRAGLPSTVRGLLFHAAEHTTRHVGQAITTSKIVRAKPS